MTALVALAAGGCASNDGSLNPTSTPTPTQATSPGATPGLTFLPTDPGTTPAATPPGQTDTDWGRIWDGLPDGFPRYPGAHPTVTGEGPASATLDVGAADPAAVMDFYRTALQGAGWIIVGVSGPREDGSFELATIDVHPACQVRVTVAPLGGSTIVAVLYGTGCPFSG